MQTARSGSVAILGVPIDNMTMKEVLNAVEASIDEGGFHQIATANVDFLINSIHDDELREILSSCDLVLPDGMPLVWASRLMGTSLKERVSGSDLVSRLVELSALQDYGIFLLGSSEASSRGAANWIARYHPLARVVGRSTPAFDELEDMDHEDILLQIEAANPDTFTGRLRQSQTGKMAGHAPSSTSSASVHRRRRLPRSARRGAASRSALDAKWRIGVVVPNLPRTRASQPPLRPRRLRPGSLLDPSTRGDRGPA
jgi:hypothetical protein